MASLRLQSKWHNAKYIVRPTTETIYPGLGKQKHPGLMVRFTGPQRIFDLESTAKAENWTEEEQAWVKKHMLQHPDFGRGLYFAPGFAVNDLGAEDRALIGDEVTVPTRKCAFIDFSDPNEFRQCAREAGLGRDFCAEHDPTNPNNLIRSGIGATARLDERKIEDAGSEAPSSDAS